MLLGQLISMAAIDQFGLLGAPTHAITLPRFIGLIFMSIGVFLAVRRGYFPKINSRLFSVSVGAMHKSAALQSNIYHIVIYILNLF